MSDGDTSARFAAARSRLEPIGVEFRVVGVGYGTVDLDRAEHAAGAAAKRDLRRAFMPAPDDLLLGARSRVLVDATGLAIVLLEPSTEGALAASLARFGETAVAEYLVPIAAGANVVAAAAAAGVALSSPSPGPLGTARLVLGGPRWGPHVILVEAPDSGDREGRAATIVG